MKPDTFFEKFEEFADAPEAVARMRELVLHLAVTGKLSKATEAWIESPLGEVSRLRRGYDLPTQDRKPGSVPIFAANGPVGVHDIHMVKGPGVVTGRSGSIGKVHFINENFWPLNTALYVEDFFGNYPQFICLLLRSLHLERFSTATAVPTLNRNVVHKEPVKLPPLAEQKRIVAKVDDLMALCDRLEAQQQEREKRHAAIARASLSRFAEAPTPANINFLFHHSYSISTADLRKSILTLAVQGTLVKQHSKDESAEEWLRMVTQSIPKADRQIAEPPFPPPQGWIWLRVANVFEVAGGIQKTPHRAPRNNAFPYLGVGNVYRGRLDLTNVKEFELELGELDRRQLEAGDLLIIEGNGSFNEIGRCAKWNGEIKNCVHQNHVIRCRPCDVRIASFVLLFLNSPIGMEMMQRLAITSSGLYSLSVGKIRQIEIPLPPLAEQCRIVKKVDQLMALVDQLESQLAASRAIGKNFSEALVAELTAQV